MTLRRAVATASVLGMMVLLPTAAHAEFRKIDLSIVGMD